MNDPYLPTWPRPVPALEAWEGLPSQPARLSSSTVSRGARFGPRHRSASEAAGLSAGQQHLRGFLADGSAEKQLLARPAVDETNHHHSVCLRIEQMCDTLGKFKELVVSMCR